MKQQYEALKEAFDAYVKGALTSEKLKPVTAPFGIYEQRNGLFMLRIRVTGGEVRCDRLKGLAELLEKEAGTIHLTSRQDIQVHDVPAEKAPAFVQACDALGLPFKGGGGNTYRNILASARSGVSEESPFDVYPYAFALNQAMQECEKAFTLPRKMKIGVFACAQEQLLAAVQDLGFLAARHDGQDGFSVYVGGGMGRDSAIGLRLFDFLPVGDVIRVAVACTELFHDHGDRANRNQARLRFLLKRIGQEAFTRLFFDYYEQVKTRISPLLLQEQEPLLPRAGRGPDLPSVEAQNDFALWRSIAVLPTRFGDDQVSVRLFVPYGNLRARHLRVLAGLALRCGSEVVRLLTSQDILLPRVHRSWLPAIFQCLRQELQDIDLTFQSYKGHLVTCVGATVCKIGMVDAPTVGDAITRELDRYLPADTPAKRNLLRIVADEVRISGCPNACSGHPLARLGIGCILQKEGSEIRPYAHVLVDAGVTQGAPHLATDETGERYSIEVLVPKVVNRLKARAGV